MPPEIVKLGMAPLQLGKWKKNPLSKWTPDTEKAAPALNLKSNQNGFDPPCPHPPPPPPPHSPLHHHQHNLMNGDSASESNADSLSHLLSVQNHLDDNPFAVDLSSNLRVSRIPWDDEGSNHTQDLSSFLLPRHHMIPSQPLKPPSAFRLGSVLNISLTSLADPNPGSFFVNILETETLDKLVRLRNEMNAFYARNADHPKIRVDSRDLDGKIRMTLKPGWILAMKRTHPQTECVSWHRVLLVSLHSSWEFKAFNIDTGEAEMVDRSRLRLLHREFALLPAQAIECKLAGVLPTGGHRLSWSREATAEFQKLLLAFPSNKFLGVVGAEVELQKRHQPLEVYLIDVFKKNLTEASLHYRLHHLGFADLAEKDSAQIIATNKTVLQEAINKSRMSLSR